MILGVIDIGSHSCRLKIEQREPGKITVLQDALTTTGLMRGLSETGRLSAIAMRETLAALTAFRQTLDECRTEAYRVIATSAMREAANGAEFARQIEAATGLKVDIISGEEEAALSYAGMREALPEVKKPLLLDVGGGSSEFFCPDIVQLSLKMGATRATETRLDEAGALLALEPLKPFRNALADCTLVGCGGTITTLAAVFYAMTVYDRHQVQGTVLTREQIEAIYQKLSSLSPEERRHLPGLQPKRAPIIVSGCFWVLQIMAFLGQSVLTVSDADLREGVLARLAQKKQAGSGFGARVHN